MPRQRKLEIVQHKDGEWYHPVRHLVAKNAGRKLKHQERNRRMAQAKKAAKPVEPSLETINPKKATAGNWLQKLKRLFI